MPDKQEVTGGVCPAASTSSNVSLRHRSTARDIDASRLVAVHICDRCKALFVPEGEPLGTTVRMVEATDAGEVKATISADGEVRLYPNREVPEGDDA